MLTFRQTRAALNREIAQLKQELSANMEALRHAEVRAYTLKLTVDRIAGEQANLEREVIALRAESALRNALNPPPQQAPPSFNPLWGDD